MNIRRKSIALLFAAAVGLAVATQAPAADDPRHGKPTDPRLLDYSLIPTGNLPLLMWALKNRGEELKLTPEQTRALAAAILETRAVLLPRLEQARALETEIARAALDGRGKQELAERLDRLQGVKREATDINIDSIQRLRALLSSEQYARLVAVTQAR